jgi:Fe2+ or Zn2+ uptake regulation protein
VRVTAQRRLLLGLLVTNRGRHWTADELWTALRASLPEVARATAYNVLEELVRVGLAEELPTRDGSLRYGLRLTSHHHFVCDACGRWFDVQPAGVDAVRLRAPDDGGFHVDRVDITLRGLCADCRAPA